MASGTPANAAGSSEPREPAPSRPPQRREPARQIVVVTCMDARIDPIGILGLSLGDANVIRNAGATISDDVLRSVRTSQSLLGTRRAVVIGHTDCAGHDSDEAAARAAADGARRLRAAAGLPDGFAVEALLYDVRTGELAPVQ